MTAAQAAHGWCLRRITCTPGDCWDDQCHVSVLRSQTQPPHQEPTMTTTTETEPTETAEELDSTEPTEPEARPLTVTEFIAQQLNSRHILDGRYVVMTATADDTRIDIDIEHPFPQERHITVVAHLEVVVPDEVDDVEQPQAGVEVGAPA